MIEFEEVHFTPVYVMSKNCCMSGKQYSPDQRPHAVKYDLGLYCLLRLPVRILTVNDVNMSLQFCLH